MQLTQYNQIGDKYYLINECAKRTRIIRSSTGKHIIVDMTLDDVSHGWYLWVTRKGHLDSIFRELSVEHREFMETGHLNEVSKATGNTE